MAKSIRQIKYGDFTPSKILFGDGTECKRVYVGDVMVWNKDDYAFSINPSSITAEAIQKIYKVAVTSTNNDGADAVPYTATSTTDWIMPNNNGKDIVVSADNQPRIGATEVIRISGDAYVTNNGGEVELPEIHCIWKNQLQREGEVIYKQGEDSELEAILKIAQVCGSGEGEYSLSTKSSWLHISADNKITADKYTTPTSERNGTVTVTSKLTGETRTFEVHQSNTLIQKKEFGIFSKLDNDSLTINCKDTEGNANLVIRYRYYQVVEDTNERVEGSETSWTDTPFKSWSVNSNPYFTGSANTSLITCDSNLHVLRSKKGSLRYTLQSLDTDIPLSQISSYNSVTIDITQNGDSYGHNGEIFYEYKIVSGTIDEMYANGESVQANIVSQYRRYKIWASDETKVYFAGETWLTDIGVAFVSQSISGHRYICNGIYVSGLPNESATSYNEGVVRFISNRVMDGQPLYIDLTVKEKYREKTTEYRLVNPELEVNEKTAETWNASAAAQTKEFNITSQVLRQYKWTNGMWYDNIPNTKEDWDYTVSSIEWCTGTANLTNRTATLTLTPNTDNASRDYTVIVKQKSDEGLSNPLKVTISVTQKIATPVIPIVAPGPEPFEPNPKGSRLTNCQITVSPVTYSVDAAEHSKNDFVVNSSAIVEYLYTDGSWRAESGRYKIGYTAASNASEWCVPSVQETDGKATVDIIVVNDTPTKRVAIVTLQQKYTDYDSSTAKTATISVAQDGYKAVEPEEIEWKNCSISATLPDYSFGNEGGEKTFTVISTGDKWNLCTDGQYHLTSSNVTLPYVSTPTVGPIHTDGQNTVSANAYSAQDERTQDITFIQKDTKGNNTGATDVKTISQAGDVPVSPEQWEDRNRVLTITPSVWNIDAASHTSSDFTYVSTVEKWQLWISGWKKMSTENVEVQITTSSASGDIKITSATNGTISVSAEANNSLTQKIKTLTINQKGDTTSASILVTQKGAEIVTPEVSKIKEDSYVFNVTPDSLSWQQTNTDAQSVTVESYGYRVYQYTDGVWRGKTNKTETGDREDVNYSVGTSTHWTITNKTSFTPKSTADKDYTENVTYTQSSSSKTKTVSLSHKKAEKVSPEVAQRYDYSIEFTSPSNPLNIDTCRQKETPYSVISKCKVKCLYNDGNYYYDRDEDVDYIMSTDGLAANIVIYDGKIKTSNLHNETEVRANVFATQNTSSADKVTLSVVIPPDEKSDTQYEYQIASASVPNIPYDGSAVTADVVCQMRSYKFWKSDNMKIEETSWSTDSDAVVSSQFVSGDSDIQSDGRLTFSATPNTGSIERKATFKFTTNRGSEKTNVEVTQVTNVYTKYDLTVTPSSHTFTTQTNGDVTLAVVCRYCISNGGVDGTWNTCDYTAEPNGVTFVKSTGVATMATNVHSTTALSGSVVFTAKDMSSVTGYAGTPPTVTVSITGCADEILNASEYRIASTSIPTIAVDGTAVTATVNCQQQDYQYWKSGGKTDRYTTTKSWYAITTPSGVTSQRTEGSSAFTGNGLSISASSNAGSTTTDTKYQLTVSGGDQNISYNSPSSTLSLVVTQEKKVGNGRTSTTSRNAKFTFTVPFPTGDQTQTDVSVTQTADEGQIMTYPPSWSKDTTKNHTITHTGTDFITLGTPTASNGTWTYNLTVPKNEGESFTGTDYRVRFNPTSLSFAANETSKQITAIHEYMDIVGGRNSTSERSEFFNVTYYTEDDSALFKQAGDPGSGGTGTGTWLTDTSGTLSSISASEGFSTTNSGNVITITTTSNEATPNTPTVYNTEVINTKYSNYSLSIADYDANVVWGGGTTTHSVTATCTETDVIKTTYETTYKSSSKKTGTLEVVTNRSKDGSATLEQAGQTKSPTYSDDGGKDGTPRPLQPYTPTLTWASGYPSGAGASAGVAPSMTLGKNANKTEVSDGWNRYINRTYPSPSITELNFDAEGGELTIELEFTKEEKYHYDEGSTRTVKGKCYDSVGKIYSNEFSATQNGEPGDATPRTKSKENDTENSATLSYAPSSGFSVDGFTITANANINSEEVTVYNIQMSPTEYEIEVGDTLTPTVTVQQRTNVEYTATSQRNFGVNVISMLPNTTVYDSSVTIHQSGSEAKTEYGTWGSSTMDYFVRSSNVNILETTSDTHALKGIAEGSCQCIAICNGSKTDKDGTLIARGDVTVTDSSYIYYDTHVLKHTGTAMSMAGTDIVSINKPAHVDEKLLVIE